MLRHWFRTARTSFRNFAIEDRLSHAHKRTHHGAYPLDAPPLLSSRKSESAASWARQAKEKIRGKARSSVRWKAEREAESCSSAVYSADHGRWSRSVNSILRTFFSVNWSRSLLIANLSKVILRGSFFIFNVNILVPQCKTSHFSQNLTEIR